MKDTEETRMAHDIIAYFFDRPIKDMGGGLTIIELPRKWMDARWADLIKMALHEYAQRPALSAAPTSSVSSDDGRGRDA